MAQKRGGKKGRKAFVFEGLGGMSRKPGIAKKCAGNGVFCAGFGMSLAGFDGLRAGPGRAQPSDAARVWRDLPSASGGELTGGGGGKR